MRALALLIASSLVLSVACSSSSPVQVSADGGSQDGGSTAAQGPNLEGLHPEVASVEGGTAITIEGENLSSSPRVWIDGVEMDDVQVQQDGSLLVTTVPHPAGDVDVRIATPAGDDVLPGALTFAVPPKLIKITPSNGNVAGGEAVTVTGSNLPADGDVRVSLGGLPLLNVVRLDADTLQGTTPAASAGVVDVSIEASNGSAKLAAAFEYRVWTGAQTGMDEAEISAIATTPAAPGLLYVAARGGAIFRSTDRGATWTQVASGITHGGQNWLVVGFHDPRVLLAICEGAQVCRSEDGGESWHPVVTTCCANSLSADPANDAIYAAGHFYVARSLDDGATWEMLYQGEQRFIRVAVDPTRSSRLYGLAPSGEVLRSEDQGTTWEVVGSGLPANEYLSDVIASLTPGRVVVSSWNSGMYGSGDSGDSFVPAAEPPASDGLCCTPGYVRLARDPQQPGRIVGAGNLLVESLDEGATWTQLGPVPPGHSTALELSDDGLYLGTDAAGLFELRDGAWSPLNTGLSAPVATTVGWGQEGAVYAATWTGHVYRSVDGGQLWVLLGDGGLGVVESVGSLQTSRGPRVIAHAGGVMQTISPGSSAWTKDSGMQWIVADPVVPGRALGSSFAGTFLTLDGGDSWTPVAFPTASEILALAPRVTSTGTEFYALTADGLYQLPAEGAWRVAGPGLADRPWKMVVTPGGSILASQGSTGSGRVWRLAPGGAAWIEWEAGGAWGLGAPWTGSDLVVIGQNAALSISLDGGETWTLSPLAKGFQGTDFAFDPGDPRHVFAAMGTGGVLQSLTGVHD